MRVGAARIDADLPLEFEGFVVPEPDATLTLDQRFEQFHAANSWVGRTLLALIDEAIAHGQDKVGVKAMFEVMRWMYHRNTVGEPWRLNNSLTSRYARWAIQQRPDLEAYIETRALRAA